MTGSGDAKRSRGLWVVRRLDVSAQDVAFGVRAALTHRSAAEREALARRVEAAFSPAGDAVAFLSVRSGFDLVLEAAGGGGGAVDEAAAAATPRGAPAGPPEILFSALTVSDMPRIATEHGWVPRPLDLDTRTMAPPPGAVAAAAGPRTRAVVLTHLYGGRADLGPLIAEARARGLLVIEDCAQAYAGPGWTGHAEADVSMFSFGPIKTRTALGGALFVIRRPELLARVRQLHAGWPEQPASERALRVLKYGGLHALSGPRAYGAVSRAAAALGHDTERLVHSLTRAFPGPEFFRRIRRRPSAGLLAMLERRVAEDDGALDARARRGARLRALLDGHVEVPGAAMAPHHYWIFPILSGDAGRLLRALRQEGFEATEGRSFAAVEGPDGPEAGNTAAREVLRRAVFLPFRDDMPDAELERMAGVVARVEGPRATVLATEPRP